MLRLSEIGFALFERLSQLAQTTDALNLPFERNSQEQIERAIERTKAVQLFCGEDCLNTKRNYNDVYKKHKNK